MCCKKIKKVIARVGVFRLARWLLFEQANRKLPPAGQRAHPRRRFHPQCGSRPAHFPPLYGLAACGPAKCLRLAGFSAGRGVCARGGTAGGMRNSECEIGARRFVLGLCAVLRLCRGDLARRAVGLAALARRFSRRAVGLAVLLRLFASVHACLFSFVRKKETACGILRSYSAGSRSPFVRSRSALRLSALAGSLRVWPFICGDLDGDGGTGLAARPLCVFA